MEESSRWRNERLAERKNRLILTFVVITVFGSCWNCVIMNVVYLLSNRRRLQAKKVTKSNHQVQKNQNKIVFFSQAIILAPSSIQLSVSSFLYHNQKICRINYRVEGLKDSNRNYINKKMETTEEIWREIVRWIKTMDAENEVDLNVELRDSTGK